ncbi:4327_t:CDS:1, partial [Ambispora leptoticha]
LFVKQSKNKQMFKHHYEDHIDKERTPPPDCPSWALLSKAIERYNIIAPEFDTDFSSGEEDPRKKKKVKTRKESEETSKRKDRDDK